MTALLADGSFPLGTGARDSYEEFTRLAETRLAQNDYLKSPLTNYITLTNTNPHIGDLCGGVLISADTGLR